jgi:hypothetical protein
MPKRNGCRRSLVDRGQLEQRKTTSVIIMSYYICVLAAIDNVYSIPFFNEMMIFSLGFGPIKIRQDRCLSFLDKRRIILRKYS